MPMLAGLSVMFGAWRLALNALAEEAAIVQGGWAGQAAQPWRRMWPAWSSVEKASHRAQPNAP
jgi:uncharacterized protein YukE